jgi:hypothetical protein
MDTELHCGDEPADHRNAQRNFLLTTFRIGASNVLHPDTVKGYKRDVPLLVVIHDRSASTNGFHSYILPLVGYGVVRYATKFGGNDYGPSTTIYLDDPDGLAGVTRR